MKAYIHRCKTISILDSFETGILRNIKLQPGKTLIEPDYKQLIPSTHLRRMSKVIRMGVAAAIGVKGNAEIQGVIVGTGLGCFDNSIHFTKEYVFGQEGLLSPLAFIQSTDNTIAGQIGLILQNNSYNITHSHKGLAFETALLDAIIRCNELNCTVLLGGVDQNISLFELKESTANYFLAEGASFFLVGSEKEESSAQVSICRTIETPYSDLEEKLYVTLQENSLDIPDLVLYGNSFINDNIPKNSILDIQKYDYSDLCGVYFTNASFGLHLAVEIISNRVLALEKGFNARKILVLNNFYDNNFGLTYLSTC